MEHELVIRLRDYADSFPVVDTHEHLCTEDVRLKQHVDFSTLFSHYCMYDLVAAGMPKDDFDAFYDSETAVDRKWELFVPYYSNIKSGSYARSAHLTMERFYGYPELRNADDAVVVSERIRQANVKGLYRSVLKDACNLRTSITCGPTESDPEFFHCVAGMNGFVEIRSVNDLQGLCGLMKEDLPTTLGRYVDAVGRWVGRISAGGVRGLKLALAYQRDLEYRSTTKADAERVFNRIYEESQGWRPVVLGYNETRPLQDYLVHRLAEMAAQNNIPLVFHTGIQTGNNNHLDNCRPERLWSLINRHPQTDFILLHGGLPWTDEAGMLAKYFANVYLDMAWMHIISPEISRKALNTWIDMVPGNKVFGFGGDYSVVEKVYGHLTMAKENITAVLAQRVSDSAMSEETARQWVRRLLYDNPARGYRLNEA